MAGVRHAESQAADSVRAAEYGRKEVVHIVGLYLSERVNLAGTQAGCTLWAEMAAIERRQNERLGRAQTDELDALIVNWRDWSIRSDSPAGFLKATLVLEPNKLQGHTVVEKCTADLFESFMRRLRAKAEGRNVE